MVMEIIAGTAVLTFIILVIFIILALRDARKTLKKTDRILHDLHKIVDTVSEPTEHLIQSLNKLTLDLKKKSEGLDVLFRPLYESRKEDKENSFSTIVEWVGGAIRLIQRIKKEVTR